MVIGVDIDGVLNDLHTPWLKLYNDLANDNLKIEDVKSYDIAKYTKPGFDKKQFYTLLDTPGLFRNAPVLEGAQEGIQHLLDYKHTVLIISAFYPSLIACAEKTEWLQEHFPMLDLRNCLIFTKAKHYIKMDMLIDDCAENLYKLTSPEEIGGTYGVLFSKPYNMNEDFGGSLDFTRFRVDNWKEIVYNVL